LTHVLEEHRSLSARKKIRRSVTGEER